MKIAHLVTSKIFAGIEQHVYELACEMSEDTEQIIMCNKEVVNNIQGVKTICMKMGSRLSLIHI